MMRTTISKQPVSPPALVRTPVGGGLRIDRKCDACADEDQEVQRAVDPGAAPVSGHQFARLSVLAPPLTAPAELLAVSEPSDPSEQEAERAAEQVMRMLSPGAPRDEGPAISTAARPLVQRAAEPGVETETPAMQGGFLVDDETGSLLPGQMRKTEFLQVLRPAVCTAADRELARAGRNTDGCPYLDRWFAYYAGRDARQVERSLRKYAPETARATSAADYIGPISERVAQGVHRWVDTGEVPELPEGVSADMLGGGGVLGALAEVGSAIGGAISSGLSAIGSFFGGLFFKAEPGGAARGADRGALDARLGAGRPLDSASRSRMGSAFGYDFGPVRVHDDAPAAELARGLNARAFTLGTHVAFGANEYRPGEPVGDALLAHELAHVVQQSGGSPGVQPDPTTGDAHNAMEDEADDAALGVMSSLWGPTLGVDLPPRNARPRRRSGLQLQRCGLFGGAVRDRAPSITNLKTKFAIAGVEDGSSKWSADELDKVFAAFGTLSGPESAAITGVTLRREQKCNTDTAANEISLARYSADVKETGPNQHAMVATLCVSDAAFDDPDITGTIVHEVGHAIEQRAQRQAQLAAQIALDAENRQAVGFKATAESESAENKAAYAKYHLYSDADLGPFIPYRQALARVDKAVDALALWKPGTPTFEMRPDGTTVEVDERAALEKAVDDAVAKRDAARTELAAKAPKNPGLDDFAPVSKAQDALVVAAKERVKLVADFNSKNDQLEATMGKLGSDVVTARLKRFVDVVQKNNVKPFTDYARSEFAKAEKSGNFVTYYKELFAEAFRLWKTQRDKFTNLVPPELVKWFDDGNYLK